MNRLCPLLAKVILRNLDNAFQYNLMDILNIALEEIEKQINDINHFLTKIQQTGALDLSFENELQENKSYLLKKREELITQLNPSDSTDSSSQKSYC